MYEWAEFRHFKYLLAILELKGVRAAAEQLFTAQSNRSTQSKQFQENASVRLYLKTKDGRIIPTPTGEAFKSDLRKLLLSPNKAVSAERRRDFSAITTVSKASGTVGAHITPPAKSSEDTKKPLQPHFGLR